MTSVAVVIPTVPSRERLLAEALASVAAQTRHPDEVIVETDPAATGAAATRNRAWRRATSDTVAFLDDDDLLYPSHLELCLAALTPDVDLVYPWYDGPWDDLAHLYDHTPVEGTPFSSRHRQHVLQAGALMPVTVLVRRAALERVGGFPEDAYPEDLHLFRRLLHTGSDFRHVPERTWRYRCSREVVR